jgi:putative phage-type endonuclease
MMMMTPRALSGIRINSDNVSALVEAHQKEPLTDLRLLQILDQRLPITQQSLAWHAARDCHITASDIAAVLGQNPYCSKYQVSKRKMQQYLKLKKQMSANEPQTMAPDNPNPACKWGIDHEPEAAALYSYVTGIPLYCDDIGLLIHPSTRCVGATPDALARHQRLLIEIKTPWRRVIQPGVVPPLYYPQLQVQMEICDVDLCHFVQYTPAHCNARGMLDIIEVKRDHEWWRSVEPKLVDFWKEVIESATGEDYSNEAIDALTKTIVEGTVPAEKCKYNWAWPPSGRYDIGLHGDFIPTGKEFLAELDIQDKFKVINADAAVASAAASSC